MEFVLVIAVILVLLLAGGFLFLRGRRLPGAVVEVRPAGIEKGLVKTRSAVGSRLAALFGRGLDAGFWSDLEETLIAADVGVGPAGEVVEAVRRAGPVDTAGARTLLESELLRSFVSADRSLTLTGNPAVVVVIGVNGSGKTTSIAKLARSLISRGRKVTLAAADTFRAGAIDQLGIWADRIGAEFVGADPGDDPAAVAFSALEHARAAGSDVVIVDTAGRLHTDRNLMDQLRKVVRVLERESGSVDEILLVLDGTIGQNSVAQAESFTNAVAATGLILTKLDGTARGGVVVAIESRLGIPVKFVGVGEGMDDLIEFDPDAFIGALLES